MMQGKNRVRGKIPPTLDLYRRNPPSRTACESYHFVSQYLNFTLCQWQATMTAGELFLRNLHEIRGLLFLKNSMTLVNRVPLNLLAKFIGKQKPSISHVCGIATNLVHISTHKPQVCPELHSVDIVFAPKIIVHLCPPDIDVADTVGSTRHLSPTVTLPTKTRIKDLDRHLMYLEWIDPTKHLVAVISCKFLTTKAHSPTRLGNVGCCFVVAELDSKEIGDLDTTAAADKLQQVYCRKMRNGKIGTLVHEDQFRPAAVDLQHVALVPLLSPAERQQIIAALQVQALRGIATYVGDTSRLRTYIRQDCVVRERTPTYLGTTHLTTQKMQSDG